MIGVNESDFATTFTINTANVGGKFYSQIIPGKDVKVSGETLAVYCVSLAEFCINTVPEKNQIEFEKSFLEHFQKMFNDRYNRMTKLSDL